MGAICLNVCSNIFAQSDSMPARLEFTGKEEMLPVVRGTRSAIVDLNFTSTGDIWGSAPLQIKWTLLGPLANCSWNAPGTYKLNVKGKLVGKKIDFTIQQDVPNIMLKIVCPNRSGGSTIPLSTPPPFQVSLYASDNARKDYPFKMGPISMNSNVTLRLACPVSAGNPVPPDIDWTPSLGQNPWPKIFNHSLNSTQITALGDYMWAYGRTSSSMPKYDRSIDVKPAQFGPGFCVYIKKISFNFPPIKMWVSSNYAASSCEYKHVLAHETKHYDDISDLFRTLQKNFVVVF